jgi:hypothetical protein
MTEEKRDQMNRRSFIRWGLMGITSIPLIGADSNLTLSQQPRFARPQLTMESLNDFWQRLSLMSPDKARSTISSMRDDLELFLTQNFATSPKQMEGFREIYLPQKKQYDMFLLRLAEELKTNNRIKAPRAVFDGRVSGNIRILANGMEIMGCGRKYIALTAKENLIIR